MNEFEKKLEISNNDRFIITEQIGKLATLVDYPPSIVPDLTDN